MIDITRRRQLAYEYWQTLDEKDRTTLQPCYGEASLVEKNAPILEKIYAENLVLCYSRKQDYILDIIEGYLKRGLRKISPNQHHHAMKRATVRFFETIKEKEAYQKALEDNDIIPYYYSPFVGTLLEDYVSDN